MFGEWLGVGCGLRWRGLPWPVGARCRRWNSFSKELREFERLVGVLDHKFRVSRPKTSLFGGSEHCLLLGNTANKTRMCDDHCCEGDDCCHYDYSGVRCPKSGRCGVFFCSREVFSVGSPARMGQDMWWHSQRMCSTRCPLRTRNTSRSPRSWSTPLRYVSAWLPRPS
jgi:hypothetical protein